MNQLDPLRYAYDIDLDSDTTATKVLKMVGRDKKVLECGCGPGHMSKVLKEHFNCDVTGIDLDPASAEMAKSHCDRVLCCDLDSIDLTSSFEKDSFDVILFADVLEHLKDPGRVLVQARDILAPKGFIVISIPNIAYAGVISGLILGEFRYRDTGLLDSTHLRFFTASGIRDLLKKSGYRIRSWDSYTVPFEFSEFKDTFQQLPDVIQAYLHKGANADTYQFIIKAMPSKISGDQDDISRRLAEQEQERQETRDNDIQSKIKALEEEIALTRKSLEMVLNSKSWKLTAPLRTMRLILDKLTRTS